MSDCSEEKVKENESIINIVKEDDVLLDEAKKCLNEENIEKSGDEIVQTFVKLLEVFLLQDSENLDKFNIKLTPEIKKYFLLLCKESPDLFGLFEENFKKIIVDNKIDVKDIPDVLMLVTKVYNVINENKSIQVSEPYKLIRTLLNIAVIVYLETNNGLNDENKQLVLSLMMIIDTTIDLIKLKPLKPIKINCFTCFR